MDQLNSINENYLGVKRDAQMNRNSLRAKDNNALLNKKVTKLDDQLSTYLSIHRYLAYDYRGLHYPLSRRGSRRKLFDDEADLHDAFHCDQHHQRKTKRRYFDNCQPDRLNQTLRSQID